MIRVGVDARLLGMPGVGRYIESLADGLAEYPQSGIQVTLYVNDASGKLGERWIRPGRVLVTPVPVRSASIVEQGFWIWRTRRDQLDIFHAPHFVFPLTIGIPTVVTLHDLVYYRFPPVGVRRLPMRAYYHAMHRFAAVRAAMVLTDSDFSASELQKLLKIPRERLRTIPLAVARDFADGPTSAASKISTDYILYVGTNKPWKNLSTLFKALAHARLANPKVRLVLAGKSGRHEESIEQLVRHYGVDSHVQILGEVSAKDLRTLYSHAIAVVCPSLYEGFGLAALEAMACGAPVIASMAASLPEVVGEAAISLPPNDAEAWAVAMNALWRDPVQRERLRALGLARARRFSLQKMTASTADVYRKLATASV